MTIILNHTIIPARDKVAAARFFASIFGLEFSEKQSGHLSNSCLVFSLFWRAIQLGA
jgi:predicted enzyme related to lactoylglutathione lyase